MTIQDTHLQAKVLRAIALQAQGEFVTDFQHELPLPLHKELVNLRYSRARDENGRSYDYETEWGKFACDTENSRVAVLRKGTPPAELLPQPRLELATATLYRGYVAIHTENSSFELDLQTRDALSWETLGLVNQTLAAENIPIVVWQLQAAKADTPPVIRIFNDSAMLFASSAVWDLDEQQLVAAQTVTTSHELLKAIKATLANNGSKNFLSVKTPQTSVYLRGARRGYLSVNNHLTAANAEGTVTVLLHPLSGDPQANPADYFYLVVAAGELLAVKFIERLDLAISWPLQEHWADYLIEAGQAAGLVFPLPSSGKDFTCALRVLKNDAKWQQVIGAGLQQGHISF